MRRSAFQATLVSTLLLLLGSSAMAAVLRVKADAPGPTRDGASWGTALPTITAALAAASSGDEVWVAAGTYAERITLPAGVSLHGGFAGTETDRAQADPTAHTSAIVGGNQLRVVTIGAGAGPETVLEGMTIRNGRIDGSDLAYGGGVVCEDASPTIRNNVITGSVMGHDGSGPFGGGWELGGTGAGLYLARSSAVVEGNAFQGNQATVGGAIYSLGGAPVVRGNTFTANFATRGGVLYADDSAVTFTQNTVWGGGVYLVNGSSGVISGNDLANVIPPAGEPAVACNASSPQITDNTIRDRKEAPAVSCFNGAAPLISRNTFTANAGGAILCNGASPAITGNTFTGNGGVVIGSTSYGALVCTGAAAPRIADNVIANNSGLGIACLSGSSPRIANNTLVRNGGGIYFYAGSSVHIVNNLVAYHATGIYTNSTDPGTAEFRNNCVFGNTNANYLGLTDPTGTDGNISADPLLANPAHGHYHIQPTSPCVDAGDDSVVSPGDLDMDGQPRVQGARVDIGVDESDGTVWNDPDRIIRVRPDGNDANDGHDWDHAKATVLSALALAEGRDEIWVAAGTYTGQHLLPSGISLYGGFTGTETAREQAAPAAQRTILDGGGTGSVVFTSTGAWFGSVLDGFTIRNASAARAVGGGNLTVRRCEVRNNAGPGIQLGVNGIVEDCVVTDNAGLGVSAATVRRCVIERNAAGGVNASNGLSGSALVENNRIVSNGGGDGVAVGGLSGNVKGIVVRNNLIALNQGSTAGGVYVGSGAQVINNTIVANAAPISGVGGLYAPTVDGVVANNIVAYNASGANFRLAGGGSFRNNNVFGNAGRDYLVATDRTGTDGNLSVDPGFASARNYHLQPSSPLVDAGDSTLVATGGLDLDGRPRIQGAAVDMGAYESDGAVWNIPPVVVRVRPDGDDAADGATWATAKATVQAAVDAARAAGGAVWVAGGTYAGPVSAGSFVSLYGGFRGTESAPAERDGTAVSTLTGDGSGPVLTLSGYLAGAVDGLTITGGKTGVLLHLTDARLTGLTVNHNGEGVRVDDAPLVLEDSVVSDNDGPAVFGRIVSSTGIRRNAMERNGPPDGTLPTGAVPAAVMIVYASSAMPVDVSGNTVLDNRTNGIAIGGNGGGVVADNIVEGNDSPGDGGGIVITGASNPFPLYPPGPSPVLRITGNRITGNRAGNGGGIWSYSSNVAIADNVITGNAGLFKGRGVNIAASSGGIVMLTGNVIAYNDGAESSAGVASSTTLAANNNTILGHQAAIAATGSNTRVDLVNNILAGNGQTLTGVLRTFRNNCEWNTTNLTPSKDPTGANGNFVADPRLAHAVTGDYHIQPDSPCVDAGDDTVIEPGMTDFEGQPRIQGDRVDIGADESDGTRWPVTPIVLHVRPDGSDSADGLTWATAKKTVRAALFGLVSGDELWVAAGEYGSDATLQMKEGVSMYGGFAGTETRRDERNLAANVSVLRMTGSSSVVTVPPGITSATVLDGFTITGGRGTYRDGGYYGGGVLCDQSSPTLSNNVIAGNAVGVTNTTGVGGGVVSLAGSPTLIGNEIWNNAAYGSGANAPGVAAIGGAITMRGNTIGRNTATRPAGVYLVNATSVLEGNLIQDQATAVLNGNGSTLEAIRNTFRNTTMVALETLSGARVANNVFDNAGHGSPAIGIQVASGEAIIENNEITGFRQSGIAVTGGVAVIATNRIRDNGFATPGGGIAARNAEVEIRGNDLSGNKGTDGAAIQVLAAFGKPLPVIEGNAIRANVGTGSSPSVIHIGGAASIVDNEISDNTGAAIRTSNAGALGRLEIRSNRMTGNDGGWLIQAALPGGLSNELFVLANDISRNRSGALYLSGGNVRLWNNRITANRGNSAISLYGQEASARDNLIAGNQVGWLGLLTVRGTVKGEIAGNTVSDNVPEADGTFAAILTEGATLIANNVVTFNPIGIMRKVDAPALRNNLVYGNVHRNYYDMPDPTGTDGNISIDPLFVDRAGGNYRLAEGSPAINAGDDSVVLPGEQDADLGARLLGEHVDIGAFESAHANPALLADALRALRLAAGLETATSEDVTRLDTDASASLDLPDATRLLRRAVGMDIP